MDSGKEGCLLKTFEDLEVYRRSMKYLVEVHKISIKLPRYERFELGAQMRRASSSVPFNIAEGFGRRRFIKDFRRFLSIAEGSSNEVVAQLEAVKRLGYADEDTVNVLQEEYRIIGRQLSTMIYKWK